MRFLVKLFGLVKFAAPALALILAGGAGAADSLKDSGEIRSPQAIKLYKSISRSLAAGAQHETSGLQTLAAPDNDDFDDAIALEGQRGTVTGDNFDATSEPGEPARARPGPGSSVWYTFTPNRTGVTIIDTFGSDFDTVLTVYTGNRVDDLIEVASNDDTAGTRQSQVAFLAEAGTTYRIAVDGFGGAEGAFTLNFERTDRLAPTNDNFNNAIALEGRRGSVAGNNVGATVQRDEPSPVEAGVVSSVWYTFTPDRDGVTIIDTFGSSFDTVLAVYIGNRVNNLVEVASNDDAAGTFQSQVTFLAESGTTYRVAVAGFPDSPRGGDEGFFTLNFRRTNQPASPNDDFGDAIALEGRRGSVAGNNIGADVQPGEPAHAGVGGISSVWYSFTPNRSGVTTLDVFSPSSSFFPVLAVYTGNSVNALDPVASGPFGSLDFFAEQGVTYRIAVDANAESPGEGVFTLSFRRTNQRSPSPNDDFDDAIALEGQRGRVAGNNVGATVQPGEPAHALFGNRSVWYTYTANNRTTELEVFSDRFPPIVAVYEGSSVDALTEVASNISDPIFNATSTLAFRSEPGVTYRIAVATDNFLVEQFGANPEGLFTLEYRPSDRVPPANDDFEDAIALEGQRGTVTESTLGATRQAFEPFHLFLGGTRSIWYTFTPSRTGIAIIDTFGSNFDTVLAVYAFDDVGNLVEVVSNDDTASAENEFQPIGVQSQVAFLAERGTEYHIAVDQFSGSGAGRVTLNYRQTNRRTPANDNFANARRLSGESGIDSGFNINATRQNGEPSHAGSGPASSVWWRWRAPFTGTVTFTTAGSNFDTVLAVYQGDTVSGLNEIASNDDEPLPRPFNFVMTQSLVTFEAQEGEVYHVAVDGAPVDLGDEVFVPEGSVTLAFTRGEAGVKAGSPAVKPVVPPEERELPQPPPPDDS